MHTVGRTYALDRGLELSDLQDVLPRSNDPGCSAGFAHGLVTGVAPSIDVRRPGDAGRCARTPARATNATAAFTASATRSCGCTAIGSSRRSSSARRSASPTRLRAGRLPRLLVRRRRGGRATLPAPAVRDPRALCAAQPERFVRPCWYRAFVDNRPAGIVVDSREHFDVLCRDLTGLQRQACVTAVSVIGPADPAAQLQLCAQLQGAADAESCIRGTKVQNLLSEPPSALVDLIGRCELFAGPTRAACYRWLGRRPPSSPTAHSPRRVFAARARRAPVVPRRRGVHGRRARHVQLSS